MSYKAKGIIERAFAYLLSVGAPIVTAVCLYPVEVTESVGLSISSNLILAGIVSLTVFRKQISKLLSDDNKSTVVIWAILLVFCMLVKNFFQEMIVIASVGCGGNLASTPLFKLSEKNFETAKKQAEIKLENELKGQMNV